MNKLQAYLNAPIPRKTALAVVLAEGLGLSYVALVGLNKVLKMNGELIQDQAERLQIYKESMDFLLDRADPVSVIELNEKLDYWRVIRGHNTQQPDSDAG